MIYSLKTSGPRSRIFLDYEINFNNYKKMYEKLDMINEMSPAFIKKAGEQYLIPKKSNYLILKAKK
ncbi:MAG: hypothetical protein OXJ52_03275 [Oligoflexia bacterium]|nr:hypothetical protein [Oligoflexia bacterium]